MPTDIGSWLEHSLILITMESTSMPLRLANPDDILAILALERTPMASEFVGQWSEERHHATLAGGDARYYVSDTEWGEIQAYAILRGIQEASCAIELKRLVRTSSLISVAEVQGDAFAFGMGLAIVTDFPLVADTASLCFPEMSHGLAPAAIMSYLGEYALPRFAFPLVLFGEPFTPRQALEIGLISQVVPAANLSAEADALIARILKLDPAAARRCKDFFLTAQSNTFEKNCALAVEALTAGTMAALARKK